MAWETVAKCDVCGAVKGEANKWLIVTDRDVNVLAAEHTSIRVRELSIYHWRDELSLLPDHKIICGESCLNRVLQPFLDSRTKPDTGTILVGSLSDEQHSYVIPKETP